MKIILEIHTTSMLRADHEKIGANKYEADFTPVTTDNIVNIGVGFRSVYVCEIDDVFLDYLRVEKKLETYQGVYNFEECVSNLELKTPRFILYYPEKYLDMDSKRNSYWNSITYGEYPYSYRGPLMDSVYIEKDTNKLAMEFVDGVSLQSLETSVAARSRSGKHERHFNFIDTIKSESRIEVSFKDERVLNLYKEKAPAYLSTPLDQSILRFGVDEDEAKTIMGMESAVESQYKEESQRLEQEKMYAEKEREAEEAMRQEVLEQCEKRENQSWLYQVFCKE